MSRLQDRDARWVRARGESLLVPVMSRRQKVEHAAFTALWIGALAWFWLWWLEPAHNIGTFRYVLTTAALAWLSLMLIYFMAIFSRARKVDPSLPIPSYWRVAMVVTKAPSEPFPVVRETLEAMLRQGYPHDTWLADEDPAPETLAWCAAHGVQVSTRKGQADYHRAVWPRRTRCKEGNLAFFYDRYGYERYDFVAQLDADHVPAEGYLEAMLRPFIDPRIGYVSAPSICDKNAAASWSARSRLYVEGTLHGALQTGYSNGLAPLCIGSHYAVRTAALHEIGGLGPELAEDHSTSLMMNAHGWRGIHAVDAIAHGDGPNSFADLATQEFQWSRSLMMILLQYTPGVLRRLPPKLRFQFLFCQLWYPLFSVLMLVMYLMPIGALAFDANLVGVTYPDFLLHTLPESAIVILMAYRWKRAGYFRPYDAKVLSWEGALFQFARWPWSLWGCVAAVRDWYLGRVVEFRVTPKGADAAVSLPNRVLMPYWILSLLSSTAVLAFGDIANAQGFYIFALINAALYALLLIVIIVRHRAENPGNGRRLDLAAILGGLEKAGLVAGVLLLSAVALDLHGTDGAAAFLDGADAFAQAESGLVASTMEALQVARVPNWAGTVAGLFLLTGAGSS